MLVTYNACIEAGIGDLLRFILKKNKELKKEKTQYSLGLIIWFTESLSLPEDFMSFSYNKKRGRKQKRYGIFGFFLLSLIFI